ncbi:MAG: hypothetical protein AAF909_11515 [Pseudomonadota bacterium]
MSLFTTTPREPIYAQSDWVAQVAGYGTAAAFRSARQRLEDEEGFPPPARKVGHVYFWRRDAVLGWAEARRAAEVEGQRALRPEDLAQDRALLRRMAATK